MKEGVLVRKLCGNCYYLSESKPYVCHKTNLDHEDNPGEDEIENPNYLKKRNRTTKACDYFKRSVFIAISESNDLDFEHSQDIYETIPDMSSSDKCNNSSELDDIIKLLKVRISNAKHENTKKIYKRHYTILIDLYHLISEGFTENEAKKFIAAKLNRNQKTVERDLQEIRDYLIKELSYC
jgi:energy-converting hydrogenase A subunit M